MLLSGVDISNYGATLLDKDIQTAEVITYQDWLRNAPSFITLGQKEKYKAITCELAIKGTDDDDILEKISNLIKQAEKCTIQFDDTVFIYDAILKDKSHKEFGNSHKIYTLNIEWASGYAYKPEITETLDHIISKTITVPGNLPTPAVVTITPTIDTISAILTGLTKNPITISNLHANTPVTIDGEKCTVTEADIDTTLTVAAGLNKWNFRKYNMASFANPDDMDIHIAPTYGTIPAGSSYVQQLILEAAQLIKNLGYDYLGHLKTAVYVTAPKVLAFNFYHDDGASIYLNGALVYTNNYHADENNGIASATMNLIAGWNIIEIIWIQHYGPDGIWGITPTIGSQVEVLNCYYARGAGSGTVNKFADTDLWAFPVLQPGENTIGVSNTNCVVTIAYKPKFM